MERTQESETPVTEYLRELFRELERLWPTNGVMSHAIGWDDDIQALVMLINVGDCVFPYVLHPRDMSDDPLATAGNLVARGRFGLGKPDAKDNRITFKR